MDKCMNKKEQIITYSNKRLSYEQMRKVCDSMTALEKPYQPYPYDSTWWRVGENDKWAYESNSWNLDHRIINKKTNQEVWSYYTDYYTG